jgi:hypothetical protein
VSSRKNKYKKRGLRVEELPLSAAREKEQKSKHIHKKRHTRALDYTVGSEKGERKRRATSAKDVEAPILPHCFFTGSNTWVYN